MLEPKSPRLGKSGNGGRPEYTAIDVAAALGYIRLHDDARHYLYVKHQCSPEAQLVHFKNMKIQMALVLICTLEKVNWPVDKLAELTDIAVRQELFANRCRTCHGVGHIRGHSCIPCNGSGSRRFTDKDKAEQMGISPEQYCRKWSKHEQSLIEVLHGWERLLSEKMNRQFR